MKKIENDAISIIIIKNQIKYWYKNKIGKELREVKEGNPLYRGIEYSIIQNLKFKIQNSKFKI